MILGVSGTWLSIGEVRFCFRPELLPCRVLDGPNYVQADFRGPREFPRLLLRDSGSAIIFKIPYELLYKYICMLMMVIRTDILNSNPVSVRFGEPLLWGGLKGSCLLLAAHGMTPVHVASSTSGVWFQQAGCNTRR